MIKTKKEKIASAIILFIILGNILAYYNNWFGLDQLIPCILGYISVWAILMLKISTDD